MSAFGTKRTWRSHCKCPLSGVKRTCRFALQMSAFTQSGHKPVAQQPVALPDVIPSHPHSGRCCTRKVFTFTPLRTSLMFMVGCSLRAFERQLLTNFRLAGHLIFLPFASALHATIACFTAIS